ncbi:MAG TPA: hypothetical protein VIE43_03455 [Thermoanaerobaculia bacterium]|jgi:hypothetical protein|nr:hypothetical protein [Thermoanaerobaculia bacterium]
MGGFPDGLWVLIPLVAILSGSFKTWLKVRAQQRVLGASNRELESEVTALRKDRDTLHQRLENIEAIVVSQTWNVVHDQSLPAAERERLIASTVRREVAPAPAAPSNQQRAEQLARRLQG